MDVLDAERILLEEVKRAKRKKLEDLLLGKKEEKTFFGSIGVGLNFPTRPIRGQIYIDRTINITWIYIDDVWVRYAPTP
jgi:hypothetical protein